MNRKNDEKQSNNIKGKEYEEQGAVSNRKRYVMKCAVQRNEEQTEDINRKYSMCLILEVT